MSLRHRLAEQRRQVQASIVVDEIIAGATLAEATL